MLLGILADGLHPPRIMRNADDHQVAVLVPGMKFLQNAPRALTNRSSRLKKFDHHEFAALGGQRDLFSVRGRQREIRRIAGPDASARDGGQEDQQKRKPRLHEELGEAATSEGFSAGTDGRLRNSSR